MHLSNAWLLYTGVVFIIASVLLLYTKREKPAVALLFFAALFIRLFAAHLDPFLNDWDEKFHALVARNMMDYPFKPMLKTEILIPYDYKMWCCNHIWLHKQPLFMWQMALSMKIFGVSEYAVRYPSVLMGALMVPMVYRIAMPYAKNTMVAFCAALLMCCSYFQFELTSGKMGMDHNDVAFGFYVLASIWAYTEYNISKKMHWVLLISLFAGSAILNKWLTGLLVFSGWGVNILLNIRNRESRKEIVHLLIALLVCTAVFLPWQLYIFHAFPVEAAYEYEFNSRHLFEVVEGHNGHNEFYFNHFPGYFGKAIWVLVPVGLVISFFNKQPDRKNNIAILTYTSVAYIFFSLVVQSKLVSYFFVVAPLCYIYMAVALGLLLKIPRAGKIVFIVTALSCGYILLDIEEIKEAHTPFSVYRQNKVYNTRIYKELDKHLPDDIYIVMNLNGMSDVIMMFYNKGINATHFCYLEPDVDILRKMGKKIAVFKNYPGHRIPGYILEYEGTYIIDVELKDTDYCQ